MKNDLCDRTFCFAKNVILFAKCLPNTKEANVIRHQLSKASTSIGANYEEAQGAFSKEDFTYRISICFRETKESNYWLRLIKATEIIVNEDLNKLIRESNELEHIFAGIMKRLNKRRGKD